jgi:uncharacterized membrane protein YeiH
VTRIRDHLLTAVDLAATFVLAGECAVVGVRADLDLFGILVLAFVGAVGGGVMRDLLLGEHPPAAFRDWRYAALAVAATLVVIGVAVNVGPIAAWTPPLALDIFEALGLALAVVAGTQKSLDYKLGGAGVVIVATINGCGGGILRDVLTAQVPRVLHTDFYATIGLLGSALMVVLVQRLMLPKALAATITGAAIVVLRTAALLGDWALPHLR